MIVLKTGGSAFEKFHRDEFTTLPGQPTESKIWQYADSIVEVKDRLFSTSIELSYSLSLPPNVPLTIDNLDEIAKEMDFPKIADAVKQDTLEVFAEDESASVQATMYNTAQKVLTSCPSISEISYSYPNKHYMWETPFLFLAMLMCESQTDQPQAVWT